MTMRNWTPAPADESMLNSINALTVERARLDTRIAAWVVRARVAGIPWRAIADALNVTTQAAQQRYGG